MHIVFGGSFNPPTKAHYEIAKTLLNRFPEATLLVLPVGDDYRKPALISFEHRYHMLSLMFKDLVRVKVLENEKRRAYEGTLASLRELEKTYDHLHFVIGSDHLNQLDTWINYKELLKSYPLIVMNRNHYINIDEAEKLYENLPHTFIFIDFNVETSSSEIRSDVEKQKDKLTKDVYSYIQAHHLYKESKHG
jgi:nicotinate-nucleotide adenylyltransferase